MEEYMSIKYDQQQVEEFITSFENGADSLIDEFEILKDKIQILIDKADFQGEFANASKSYMRDAVFQAIEGFLVLLTVYKEQYNGLKNEAISPINSNPGVKVISQYSATSTRISTDDVQIIDSKVSTLYTQTATKAMEPTEEIKKLQGFMEIDTVQVLDTKYSKHINGVSTVIHNYLDDVDVALIEVDIYNPSESVLHV